MYTIQVTKTETIEAVTKREWTRGGTEGRDSEDPDSYGYTPQVPEIKTITRNVLEMRVKDLDLTTVVTAILDNSDNL